jgi:MtaA/CmuA family methyltransferase
MNGHQRIAAALLGEWPDKVPVMLHNFMPAAREAGLTQAQFREHPDLAAKAFIQAVEKYDLDGILVDLDTATLAGAVGVPVEFPVDSPAVCNGGCLSTLEAVRDLVPVDLSNYRYVRHWLEVVRQLRSYFDSEVFVRGNCDQAPFALACAMRTPADLMMDLCDPDAEELITRLLEYCTGVSSQFICLMAQTGAHMVSNGDSPAGPAMISPAMYAKYALPAEKAVIAAAHAQGLPYALHICGDTALILEPMARTGTDAVEIDYKTDLTAAHAVLKDSITFIGNIDPSGVIARGTAGTVRAAVKIVLDKFADTPRFILNAGCAIPPTAPEENIRAMVETARAFR